MKFAYFTFLGNIHNCTKIFAEKELKPLTYYYYYYLIIIQNTRLYLNLYPNINPLNDVYIYSDIYDKLLYFPIISSASKNRLFQIQPRRKILTI